MNGLAGILRGLGYRVSGSDINSTEVTARLEGLGVRCFKGHAAENLGDADTVVTSTAIPGDNVELIAARQKGLPVIHRGDMLAMLMEQQKGIAVAGTHGKTSTSAMISLIAERNHLDPTIVIGGELKEIGGNAKFGRGAYLIAEADESDGSFLKLNPLIEVITNIEDDHLDHYKTIHNINTAFMDFMAKVPQDGMLIACNDQGTLRELLPDYKGPCLTYSLAGLDADYTLSDVRYGQYSTTGVVSFRGNRLGVLELTVPGKHNLSNALAALAAALHIGLPFHDAAPPLKEFKGAGRRFQFMGTVDNIDVVDDYAHHPTEVMAVLNAARQKNKERVVGVFQPHRYTRTAHLSQQFGSAFGDADVIIVSDIYSAGEKPINGVSAMNIVKAIEKHEGREVIYLPGQEEIVTYLAATSRPGDLVLTMGAGDVWQVGAELVARLKER